MAGDVCPWWLGFLLVSPLRKLIENPKKILGGLIKPGMTVLDLGPAMGFFTLPMARMVGPEGRVIAVDLQEKMINSLKRRAKRAGLLERLDLRVCGESDLGLGDLEGRVDLACAIHVVHEVPEARAFMDQVYAALRPGGRLLLREPKGHVSANAFEVTARTADEAGFVAVRDAVDRGDRAALFEKRGD